MRKMHTCCFFWLFSLEAGSLQQKVLVVLEKERIKQEIAQSTQEIIDLIALRDSCLDARSSSREPIDSYFYTQSYHAYVAQIQSKEEKIKALRVALDN